jgi:hypothetical protein
LNSGIDTSLSLYLGKDSKFEAAKFSSLESQASAIPDTSRILYMTDTTNPSMHFVIYPRIIMTMLVDQIDMEETEDVLSHFKPEYIFTDSKQMVSLAQKMGLLTVNSSEFLSIYKFPFGNPTFIP